MENKLINRMAPLPVWTGALVFSVPFLCLITSFGVGLASFLFLLAALCMWRDGRQALARHWSAVRWVVLAFLLNFAWVLLCFALRPEQPLSSLEKPLRMLCAVSALMVVLVARPSRQAMWWGAIAGAFGAMLFVAYQRIVLGMERPGGMINAITFGDIALVLGLVALASMGDARRAGRSVLWALAGGLAGLLALALTGTRGGWIAVGLAALLGLRLGRHPAHRKLRPLLGAGAALVAVLYFVPASDMQARLQQGIDDVRAWRSGGEKFTNVGVRLELWKGAGMLIAERPLFGADPGTAHRDLERWVREGRLSDVALVPQHLHNDALQALVTGGLPGLLALFGILAAPFAFFAREARCAAERGAAPNAPALAGMLVALGYFGFGLTEMMFWSGKACIFYALMIFILMGLCLNAKE